MSEEHSAPRRILLQGVVREVLGELADRRVVERLPHQSQQVLVAEGREPDARRQRVLAEDTLAVTERHGRRRLALGLPVERDVERDSRLKKRAAWRQMGRKTGSQRTVW